MPLLRPSLSGTSSLEALPFAGYVSLFDSFACCIYEYIFQVIFSASRLCAKYLFIASEGDYTFSCHPCFVSLGRMNIFVPYFALDGTFS